MRFYLLGVSYEGRHRNELLWNRKARFLARKTQSLPVIAFFFCFFVFFCFIAFVPCFLKFGASIGGVVHTAGNFLVYVCYNTDIYASREYAVEKIHY